MKYSVLAGRILFSLLFLFSAPGHFNEHTIAFAASQGVPFASVLVPFSGVIELVGGLSIMFGYRAKAGAWLLVIFLIPVTLMLHQFWAVTDPLTRQMEIASFLKNISLTGAALMITHFGSGGFSIGNALKKKAFTSTTRPGEEEDQQHLAA